MTLKDCQLLLIQILAWFPAVFVLMNRRREKDYDIVCKAIRKAATLHKLHLKPDTIMTDFEIAAIKSLGYNFNAKMKGCLFHFGQSISTKFKKLGFQTLYQLNKGVKLFFRKVFIMALLPPSEVPAYWEELIVNKPTNFDLPDKTTSLIQVASFKEKIEEFLAYFTDYYFEGVMNMEIWNHYETVDRPRTNNNVEGHNSKLKKYVGAAKPNIFKAINVFQQEEVNSTLKYTQALAGANIPGRRKLDVDKDGHLRTFKTLFLNKDITLEVYIRNIIELYSFPALEPKEKKKKSTEDDSDSGDSDSDSDDLNEIDSEDSDSE